MRCGDGDPCKKTGLNTVIGGADGEGRGGLVFDADNPCGMETNEGGVDVAALRRVRLYSDCIEYTGEPGERVMIIGHVLSRTTTREAGPVPIETLNPCGDGVVTTSPRIKLAISSCGIPGEVIIDSDSQISMPAGLITIDALIPGDDAAGDDGWAVMGTTVIASPETFTQTQLVVRACPPAQCWCPGGVLTEWLPGDPEAPETRALIRPRRARSLAVQSVDAGGPTNPLATIVEWSNARGGLPPIGATNVLATTQQTIDPVGAAPFWRVTPAGTGVTSLRWGIV